MRTRRRTPALALLLIATATALPAQDTAPAVAVGYTDVGGVLGIGGIGDAGLAFGGRFGKIIKALPDMGNGMLGFTISADWWSYDNHIGATDFGFSYIPIGATVDYHFNLTNKKFVPFVGAGLGYVIVNSDFDGPGVDASALYFAGRIGGRFLWTEKVAFYADAGVGGAAVNIGATLRLK
jgi:hypothetical protein